MRTKDASGNEIVNSGNNIFLLLVSGEKRLIGEIFPAERFFSVVRDKSKHLLRKANAYGFNHFILENATRFDDVLLKEIDGDTITMFRIPRKYILENGSFLWFKNAGFERQIFVTLDKLSVFATNINPTF